VMEMTLEEEGAYRRALDICWLHGSLPADPERLAKAIGKGASVLVARVVLEMFVLDPHDPSRVIHDRLDDERVKQQKWREKSAKGGKAGAGKRKTAKKLGGINQTATKATANGQPNGNQIGTLLSSSSNIYSSKEEYQRESETATPPAPKPASRSRDDRTDHPAIQAVRLVTNRFPDKVVWDKLISELGTPDLQKLTSCHVEWVARGFKPTNLAWAFEWYKNGIPEKQSNGTNRQNQNGNGRKSTLERIADHADIIAQYPTEAELRGQS